MDGSARAAPAIMAGYEEDFCAWALDQAQLLRALAVPGLDHEHLAEEIESLARRDKRELLNRTIVLLTHLLKWQIQPDRRGASWTLTIQQQRRAIRLLLEDSPSLRPSYPAVLDQAYAYACKDALVETGLAVAMLPLRCAWTISQVQDEGWLPE